MTPKPRSPVCLVCGTALQGVLGGMFSLLGIRRSPRNPNVCTRCDFYIDEGRVVEISVLFADLTGFTDLTNRLGAERTFAVIDAFLKMATERVVQNEGFIDKYIGDAVMAFFNVPIRHEDHARRAVAAGIDIIQGLAEVEEQTGQPLRARVGVAKGYARVGRLGSADRRDYTVIGDVANLASRLEGQARPGEVVVADQAFEQVAGDYPTAQPDHLRIKGFADEVTAYRIPVANRQKDGPLPAPRVDRLELSRRVSLATVLFTILGVPFHQGSVGFFVVS